MLFNYARHTHDTFDSHVILLTYFTLKDKNTTIYILRICKKTHNDFDSHVTLLVP